MIDTNHQKLLMIVADNIIFNAYDITRKQTMFDL